MDAKRLAQLVFERWAGTGSEIDGAAAAGWATAAAEVAGSEFGTREMGFPQFSQNLLSSALGWLQ
jgi:hypothetical protein